MASMTGFQPVDMDSSPIIRFRFRRNNVVGSEIEAVEILACQVSN